MFAAHLSAGTSFHGALQKYFDTKETPAPQSSLSGLWTSVTSALVNINDSPELIEAPIVHPVLQYKGIVDCVSNVKYAYRLDGYFICVSVSVYNSFSCS